MAYVFGRSFVWWYARKYGPAKKEALEAVAKRYAGQSVAFWPRQELLRIRFSELNEQKAGSAAYQALYADCLTYEKERKAQSQRRERLLMR